MSPQNPVSKPLPALLLGAFALAAPLGAQCMNPNLGIGTGSGSDTVTLCAPLGFTFDFPDGQTANAVSVDSNGRVFPVGADSTDWTASVGEMLAQTTALMPLWTDMGGGPDDDVYCWSNGVDTAVITWVDANYNFGSAQFTMQVELHADNSFRFVYDERMRDISFTADATIVGFTGGNDLSTDPGESDWSTALFNGPIDTGSSATGYELRDFDLSGLALDFVPNGIGGYTVSASPCGYAFASVMGESCSNRPPTSITFTNDPAGDYSITLDQYGFDPNVGIDMGHGDDTIIPANLGFTLRMPGSNFVNTVDVDSNGRVLPVGADSSDFTPSILELTSEQSGHVCAFWTDISQTSTSSVDFWSDGGSLATVTWRNVRQFGVSNDMTIQLQMRRVTSTVSSFTIVFEDTVEFTGDQLILGVAGGSAIPDPGESDLSSGAPIAASPTVYEFFDPTTEVYDMQPVLPSTTIEFTSHPVLGGSLDLTLDDMQPNNLGSFIMIGFTNVNVSLEILGMPCFLYSDNAIPAIQIGAPGATTATWSLPIQSVDTPLVLQGAVITPGVNDFGLDLTRAVEALTGV